jgi:DNA-binding transcriptional MerR regulator
VSREAGLNKAPDAFRTISEVAEDLDLPQHVLRFWESRFPHIKPLKRGGGRRYYRPEDIDLLRGIRRLLYSDGYTIKGVQRILREQGVRTVQAVGQGQEVPNLAAPQDVHGDDIHGDDAAGDENGINGAQGDDILAPPDQRPFSDAEDESGEPEALGARPATARSAPLPKNGPIAGAGVVAVAQVARVEAAKRQAPVAAASVAAVSSAAASAATVSAATVSTATVSTATVSTATMASTTGPVYDGGLAVYPAAVPSPPRMISQGLVVPHGVAAQGAANRGLAGPDLDRLRQALADLEACRRLLDKAIDGRR